MPMPMPRPTPISSWDQIPPEYRERVNAALRHMVTPDERRRRRLWIGGVAGLIVAASIAWMLGYQQASLVALNTFWVIVVVIMIVRQPAMEHRDALRFADAVRAVGLVAADVPPRITWKQRWRGFAPPSKGLIQRDWHWVRHRGRLVRQRLGGGLMWRYREEMYRRRFRYLLPGIVLIILVCYIPFMLLGSWLASIGTDSGPFAQIILDLMFILPLVLMGVLTIAWTVFYFIHESWRPTWAALNTLGSPTCMRCGEGLTLDSQQPCAKCGTSPGEEVVWSEALRAPLGPLEPVTPRFIPDSQSNQRSSR